MDGIIISILAVTAAITAGLAMTLGVVKVVHRELLRYRGMRTAYYIAALGEMLSRRILPSRPRRGWAEDPLFHDAIADYRLMVTGDDRRFVDQFIEKLGIGEVLVGRVQRRYPKVSRLRALTSLVSLASIEHIATLQSLVDDANPHVRINAVRGLARVGDVAAVPHILDIATRVKPWETARTADALVEMGSDVVEPVLSWIAVERTKTAPSIEVLAMATRLLGLIADSTAEPMLISMLGSAHPDCRVAAASALEHAGTDEAVEPLRIAIHDDDWRVRARAVVALGGLADDVVLDDVAQLLTDRQWWVRQNAATALSKLAGGNERLFASLESPDPFAADAALHQLTTSGELAKRHSAASS